jgi:hypothetical protein
MERVRKDFQGQGVEFLLAYVREAHPGERYPAHKTQEQKIRDAKDLTELENIGAKILVDDLEGTIHRSYGQQPNMLYVIDKQGRVFFRALWAEEISLRWYLTALLRSEQKQENLSPKENLATLIPMVHGMGETTRVLERAGNQAVADFERAIGRSVLLVAHVAACFRPALRAAPALRFALGGAALGMPALFFLLKRSGRKKKALNDDHLF